MTGAGPGDSPSGHPENEVPLRVRQHSGLLQQD
jgi:hypothetical protein